MDSFTYISVLLSIVLGLAITQVLLGFRGLILTRAKVKPYIPTDMGGHRAPDSDSSVVGRLRDAQAAQLDIFGASRDHAASGVVPQAVGSCSWSAARCLHSTSVRPAVVTLERRMERAESLSF
jgi:hypothetical protein